jgi:hypothetical protein
MGKTSKARTCRLTLAISGVEYRLTPGRPDLDRGAILVWSLHKLGTSARYEVAETMDGPICTCPDHRYSYSGQCKHIRSLKVLKLI